MNMVFKVSIALDAAGCRSYAVPDNFLEQPATTLSCPLSRLGSSAQRGSLPGR
jgi:hypothetical protein